MVYLPQLTKQIDCKLEDLILSRQDQFDYPLLAHILYG